jgi:hypothetical protein
MVTLGIRPLPRQIAPVTGGCKSEMHALVVKKLSVW